jgi:hypothetical protein
LGRLLLRIERSEAVTEVLRRDWDQGPPFAEVYPFPTTGGRWFWAIRDKRTGACVITTYADFERALGELTARACRTPEGGES